MREEGPAALYKGFVPKVLRLAPGGGVLLLVVEFTLEVFRKSSSRFRLHISIHLTFYPRQQLSDLPIPKHLARNRIHGNGGYINYTSTLNEHFLGYNSKYIPRLESRWRGYFLHACVYQYKA